MRICSRALLLLVLMWISFGGRVAQAQQAVTYNSVPLTWTAPGDDSLTGTATRYDLRYSTAAITASNFATATAWTGVPTPAAAGTSQSAVITGLQPATTYWFAIKTVDDAGNWSGVSNIISRTTLAAPDTLRPAIIANVAATSTTETGAVLTWTAVGDDSLTGRATSYDIRYSRTPITSANWASATQVTGEPVPAAALAAETFTVTGLTRQTTYYFAVRAADEVGNLSLLSNVPSVTTPDQTRPAAVTDMAVGFIWIGTSTSGTLASQSFDRPRGRRRS